MQAYGSANVPHAKDKLLFTPGPLTTSLSVKQVMLHDAGSWDVEFNTVVAEVRERLLNLAGLSRNAGWETILLQGSGTRSEEHTSELQSHHDLVCRLLLEKKKKKH